MKKPTPLQARFALERFGVVPPKSDKILYRIIYFLGWPNPDPNRLELFLSFQTKWLNKKVEGGANEKAPEAYAGRTGVVLAVVTRSTKMKKERLEDLKEVAAAFPEKKIKIPPVGQMATFEGLIKWDDSKSATFAALCYFRVTE